MLGALTCGTESGKTFITLSNLQSLVTQGLLPLPPSLQLTHERAPSRRPTPGTPPKMARFGRKRGGDDADGAAEPRARRKLKISFSMKPTKVVALLGLLLVLCGMGFAYLGFDVGLQQHTDMREALLVASGTQQMVCATVCISTGILVWAISVNQPVAEQYG